MESDPDLVYRFVGAQTLLGIAYTRAGNWDRGRSCHVDALENLKSSDHLYTNTFRVLSACGLGDIELRCGNYRAALAHYRHAWRTVKEQPRMVGNARLLIRASSGLAAAYAAAGELDRARELRNEAVRQAEAVAGKTVSVTFEVGLAQLYLGLAVADLRLGNTEQAAQFMQKARDAGWLDWKWLQVDPELQPLREHPIVVSFIEDLRSTPAIDVPQVLEFSPGRS
jgi:tetratricopeptide (TPR) repeat protein